MKKAIITLSIILTMLSSTTMPARADGGALLIPILAVPIIAGGAIGYGVGSILDDDSEDYSCDSDNCENYEGADSENSGAVQGAVQGAIIGTSFGLYLLGDIVNSF